MTTKVVINNPLRYTRPFFWVVILLVLMIYVIVVNIQCCSF
ncbi:MAG: hypothetical protein SNG38_05990 [Rikenellaceae bacterium]